MLHSTIESPFAHFFQPAQRRLPQLIEGYWHYSDELEIGLSVPRIRGEKRRTKGLPYWKAAYVHRDGKG